MEMNVNILNNENNINVNANNQPRQMNYLLPSSRELAPREPSKRELCGEAAAAAAAEGKDQEKEKEKQQCFSISRLESLPVELLEMIFLYSLNVNLPRASLLLARALSRERIYRLLILLAFWDDSDSDEELTQTPMPSYVWDLEKKNNEAIFQILRPLGREY